MICKENEKTHRWIGPNSPLHVPHSTWQLSSTFPGVSGLQSAHAFHGNLQKPIDCSPLHHASVHVAGGVFSHAIKNMKIYNTKNRNMVTKLLIQCFACTITTCNTLTRCCISFGYNWNCHKDYNSGAYFKVTHRVNLLKLYLKSVLMRNKKSVQKISTALL